jgi:putative ABC transport system permease protein
MWIAVRERTGEVGTVRAIGMSRQRVLWMFLTEALLLGLVSTTIGALLGGGLALAIDVAAPRIPVDAVEAILMSDHVNMTVKPVQMVSAVIGFTLVSGLSALWPALRASRMQPVTAISHVG